MRWTLLFFALLLGCPNTVPDDAGPDATAEDVPMLDDAGDAGGDAGPCGACPAATPFCVADACVACRDAADCLDPLAPQCSAGSCVSCLDRTDCGPLLAREVEARWCQAVGGAPPTRDRFVEEAQQRTVEASVTALLCGHLASGSTITLVDALGEGRTRIDVAAFQRCTDQLATFGPSFALFVAFGCPGAYVGTLANGEACVLPQECSSGYCRVADGACSGVCAARSVPIGSPCTDDGECVVGAYCSGTCRMEPPDVRLGRGQPCTISSECEDDLYCAASTCEPYPGAGMPCVSEPLRCAPGNYCDAEDTCRARVAEGGACTDVVSCVAGTRCAMGTCRSVSTIGGACDATRACPAGTQCAAGRCEALPDVGEACTDACYRGVCTGGMCTSQAPGTSCPPGSRALDALDPCGEGASCRSVSGSWTCTATVANGATCSGTIPCDEPDAFCDSGTCTTACML